MDHFKEDYDQFIALLLRLKDGSISVGDIEWLTNLNEATLRRYQQRGLTFHMLIQKMKDFAVDKKFKGLEILNSNFDEVFNLDAINIELNVMVKSTYEKLPKKMNTHELRNYFEESRKYVEIPLCQVLEIILDYCVDQFEKQQTIMLGFFLSSKSRLSDRKYIILFSLESGGDILIELMDSKTKLCIPDTYSFYVKAGVASKSI